MVALTTRQVVEDLHAAGLSVTLTPDRALKVVPACDLTPVLRDLIRAHKVELVAWLTAANDATAEAVAPIAVANLPDRTTAPVEAIEASINPAVTAELEPCPPVAIVGTPPDPDRWCWPHTDAMTGAEIATYTSRQVLFTAKGLTTVKAEVLADTLLTRDRDGDDRRICLECSHLSGWNGRRQCRGLQYAGMGGPLVSAGQVAMLQRCNGFKAAS